MKTKTNRKSKMKHLLKILFLLPFFLSCINTQEEPIPTPEEEQTAIGFAAKVENSRAESSLSNVQTHGFSVWGGYGSYNVFDGTTVTYDTNTREWGYVTNDEPTRYWALNQEYIFFAAYPKNVTENVTVTNGTYSLAVTTPSNPEEHLDILTASAYTNTGETNFSNVVSFNFSHLLTKVNLMVGQDFAKNSADDFIVTKVTLSGIRAEGTYNVSCANGSVTTQWQMTNATTNLEKEYNPGLSLKNLGEGNFHTVWGEDGLLLIPQTIASQAVKIRVDYIWDTKVGDEDIIENDYMEAFLPATDIWQSGKAVTYSIKISDERNIVFMAPTVESWSSPPTGGSIIIK